MISEREARQLLIDSCHSSTKAADVILEELQSPEFVRLLVKIAVDSDDHQGDAPMQAAYYLSKAPPSLTRAHEAALLALLDTDIGYGGSVAIVLGRMMSRQAKPVIAHRLAEGWWPADSY